MSSAVKFDPKLHSTDAAGGTFKLNEFIFLAKGLYKLTFITYFMVEGVKCGLFSYIENEMIKVVAYYLNGEPVTIQGRPVLYVEEIVREQWVSILIHPKRKDFLLASHPAAIKSSEKEALAYTSSNGWKVSHAVKVWPPQEK